MFIWWSGKQRWVTTIVLVAVVVGLARTGSAQQPTRAELEERVRRLEQIIRDAGLDKPAKARAVKAGRATVTAEPVEPAPNKEEVEALVEEKLRKQKVLAGWKDGFFLESPGGDFKLKVRGYAQANWRSFPFDSGDTGVDQFYMRRVRPIFEGTVYKYFDFRIMPDFGLGTTTLQDAYMRINYVPWAQLWAGKFKEPVSLERLQSGSDLQFIERSIANNLAPNRDTGVELAGDLLDGRLNYQLEVGNGNFDGGSNDGDLTSEKEFAGRVFTQPFKNEEWAPAVRGLGFGLAGTYGTANVDPVAGLSWKTAGRSTFFKLTSSSSIIPYSNGNRSRLVPQAYYYWGPFGFMGEYIDSRSDLLQKTKVSKKPAILKDGELDATGWFVQASYVLTGEDATYKMVTPINNFDPVNGRWGAFEVAARVSQVEVNNSIFEDGFANDTFSKGKAGSATTGAIAYTAGLNWYFNKNFRLQLNWEHTNFDQKIQYGQFPRDQEDVFLTEFQIQY